MPSHRIYAVIVCFSAVVQLSTARRRARPREGRQTVLRRRFCGRQSDGIVGHVVGHVAGRPTVARLPTAATEPVHGEWCGSRDGVPPPAGQLSAAVRNLFTSADEGVVVLRALWIRVQWQ